MKYKTQGYKSAECVSVGGMSGIICGINAETEREREVKWKSEAKTFQINRTTGQMSEGEKFDVCERR